jgi:hypothetical protein
MKMLLVNGDPPPSSHALSATRNSPSRFYSIDEEGQQPQLHQARRVDMTAQPTPVMDTPAAAASMVVAGSAALMDEEQHQQLSGDGCL